MHIIFESVLMLSTNTYQNYSMLVESTACHSWHVFLETQCISIFGLLQIEFANIFHPCL